MQSEHQDKPLMLVVVQPTSFCNLNCSYCYVPGRKDTTLMSDHVLEAVFRTTVGSPLAQSRKFQFLWHAGEPLTAGRDFFQKAMNFCESFPGGLPVVHSLQTNGTLINDKWVSLFTKYNFKIGISMDGPAFLHNARRKTWGGHDTLHKVLRGFNLCRDAGLQPGALAVLTSESLDYPDEIFEFFVENNITSFGFNAEEVENANTNTSFGSTHADPPRHLREKFTEFYSRIFDLWWPLRHTVSVREFLDISHVFEAKKTNPDYYRQPMETEALGIVTIHRNGDITPFSPEFSGAKDPQFNNFIAGNVCWLDSMEEIRQSPIFRKMYRLIQKGQHNCAETCPYFDFCGSAFVSNRYFETGRLDGTESTTCIFQRQIVSEVLLQKLKGMSVRKMEEEAVA